jgi:hypothetical protein
VLAQSLEAQTLLSQKRHFYLGDPFDFSGLHNSIVEGFIGLVVVINVNNFEVCSRYIFGVLLRGRQLDVLQP